ncbi:FAS-associated factor 1-like, partial [Arapaima gigas]
FSKIAAPLTALLKGKKTPRYLSWDPQVEQAFDLESLRTSCQTVVTSTVWSAFFECLGVSVSLSSGYHLQSNGQCLGYQPPLVPWTAGPMNIPSVERRLPCFSQEIGSGCRPKTLNFPKDAGRALPADVLPPLVEVAGTPAYAVNK